MGPLFSTSGDVASGFQSQSGQPYKLLTEAYVMYIPLRFTSGMTPVLVYNAGIAASRLPHTHVSAAVGCQPPGRQSDALTTRPRRLAYKVQGKIV